MRLDTVVGMIGITNVLRMASWAQSSVLEDENPTTERLTSNAVWLTNIITIMLQYSCVYLIFASAYSITKKDHNN